MDNSFNISGNTKLYSVIGSPIKHSLSPKIYNLGFKELNIDAVYLAFECEKKDVLNVLNAVKTLNICGVNVTMPCKEAVVKHMDWLCPIAKATNAVNTIVNNNGKLSGYNTDGKGLIGHLLSKGIDVKNKTITILGSGGAAKSIVVSLLYSNVKKIINFNRSIPGLDDMKSVTNKINSDVDFEFLNLNEKDELSRSIKESDILINATPMGMAPDNIDDCCISKEMLHKDICVYDIVYNPRETKLFNIAKGMGVNCLNGEGMLYYQANEAFKLYTGYDLPDRVFKNL